MSISRAIPFLCGLVALLSATPGFCREGRFDHVQHFEVAKESGTPLVCTNCHVGDAKANAVRPAHKDHTSCDSAGCHAKEFYDPDVKVRTMCTVCHENAEPWADMRALKTFPTPRDSSRVYCISFSHKGHSHTSTGDEVQCDSCHHISTDGARYIPPGHADCSGCHEPNGARPMMNDCQGCHELSTPTGAPVRCSPTISWRSRKMVGRFSHDTHRLDIRKKSQPQLQCDFCHSEVADATSVRGIQLLQGVKTMERACGACHNGRTRVPGKRKRVFSTDSNCSRCHGEGFVQFQAFGAPPPNH